mmetsp:Transcript_14440/g.31279  ORF Transcript_14440/g.31279 Transcript_14440/m.31279 type:complete len:294 (+) Transcript_14440:62-943(+)
MAASMKATRLHRVPFAPAFTRPSSRIALSVKAQTAQEASANYKKAAASLFVDRYVSPGIKLGLGSGELVNLAIEEIGSRLAGGRLSSVVAVPTCDAAASAAAFHGLPLSSLEQVAGKVDVMFEEVDQLDRAANAAIKGVRSEPQQPQLVAARQLAGKADKVVVLVDEVQVVERLRGTLPVVVDSEAWEETAEELDDIFIGDAELWRRPATGTATPRGGDNPYLSPEGHHIIDVRFEGSPPSFKLFGEQQSYASISEEVMGVEGVVTHGLLLGEATAAIIARKSGVPEVVEFQK